MIRRLVLVALLTVIPTTLTARKIFSLGIKAGMIIESVDPVYSKEYSGLSTTNSGNFGFQIGGMARIDLRLFYIQPEIIYNRYAYKLNYHSKNPSEIINRSVGTRVRSNTIEIPILFGVQILAFRFNAGPVFNLMNEVSSSKDPMVDIIKPTVSFQVGVGATVKNLNFDLRYHGQFVRPKMSVRTADLTVNCKAKLRRWEFSMGYMF